MTIILVLIHFLHRLFLSKIWHIGILSTTEAPNHPTLRDVIPHGTENLNRLTTDCFSAGLSTCGVRAA